MRRGAAAARKEFARPRAAQRSAPAYRRRRMPAKSAARRNHASASAPLAKARNSLALQHGFALMLDDALRNPVALTQSRGVKEHRAGPPVHVELLHQAAHAAHAHALLVGRHRQRAIERVGALLAMIRVD